MRPHLNNSWDWRCVPVILGMQGSTNRNIMVFVSFGIKKNPISKISNKNGLVEWLKWSSSCLTNAKCKAVNSYCSTTKKKRRRNDIGHILFMTLLISLDHLRSCGSSLFIVES
jgi:hypothetical protein